MGDVIEYVKITCKCGFESVFLAIPRRASCVECGAEIVLVIEEVEDDG